MRDELANVVYPVFSYGLRLKDRVDRGDELNLLEEQTALKKRLLSESEARRWPDFGGQPLDEAELGRLAAAGAKNGEYWETAPASPKARRLRQWTTNCGSGRWR